MSILWYKTELRTLAMLDSGVDLNGIQEWLIPTQYYEKTIEQSHRANSQKLKIDYKISGAHICNKKILFQNYNKRLQLIDIFYFLCLFYNV